MGKKIKIQSLETIFWMKNTEIFVADPGSGIFLTLDPGSGINIPDPQHWPFLSSNFHEYTGGGAVGAAD
jgi:hypothetical protein